MNSGESAAVKFCMPIHPLLLHVVCKRRPTIPGQVTRLLGMTPRQVTFLHLCRCTRATVDDQTSCNLEDIIRSYVATICMSRIFPIGDLRTGLFLDVPILSQWEKNQIPPIRIRPGYFIMDCVKAIVDDPAVNFGQ